MKTTQCRHSSVCSYSLESVDDFGDCVEVADVPAGLQQAQNTRQDGLAIIMTRLVDDDVRHPCTHLRHSRVIT